MFDPNLRNQFIQKISNDYNLNEKVKFAVVNSKTQFVHSIKKHSNYEINNFEKVISI